MPWIQIEGDVHSKFKLLLLVNSSEEATRLSEGDAQQVTHAADDAYPQYRWRSVRIMGFDAYIVEGIAKQQDEN